MNTISTSMNGPNIAALGDQGRTPSPGKTNSASAAASQIASQSPARVAPAAVADWSPEKNWVSRMAQDPASAHRLAESYAYNDDLPLIDASEFCAGKGPMRYVATGQPVTEKSDKEFKSMAATLKEGRIQVYESEKAKGTPDTEILNKIRSFMDQNASTDYLKLMDWERISGRSTSLTVFA